MGIAKNSSAPMIGLIIGVIGIILIIAGGGYALYERINVPGTHLTKLAFNPTVDVLGFIGVVLLIVGAVMYFRTRSGRTNPAAKSGTSSDPASTQSDNKGMKGGSSGKSK